MINNSILKLYFNNIDLKDMNYLKIARIEIEFSIISYATKDNFYTLFLFLEK